MSSFASGEAPHDIAHLRIYGVPHIKHAHSIEQAIVAHFPTAICERKIIPNASTNKLFCSAWVNERSVVAGTASNMMILLDTFSSRTMMLPPPPSRSNPPGNGRGIHCMEVSPSQEMMVTGGGNPNDAVVYNLPTITPSLILEGAEDWIFAAQWVTEHTLVTGSRDGGIRLYSCKGAEQVEFSWKHGHPPFENKENIDPRSEFTCFRVPLASGIGTQGFESTSPHVRSTRIRDMAMVRPKNVGCRLDVLDAMQMLMACGCGTSSVWDVHRMKEVYVWHLPCIEETSCVEHSNAGFFAVGTRGSICFIDSRMKRLAGILSTNQSCTYTLTHAILPLAARSLQFRGHLMSVGGGKATLTFADVRKKQQMTTRTLSQGQIVRDALFHELQQDPRIHQEMAAFTHRYNPSKTRLFVGGGPLYCGYTGTYAATW